MRARSTSPYCIIKQKADKLSLQQKHCLLTHHAETTMAKVVSRHLCLHGSIATQKVDEGINATGADILLR